MTQSRVCRLFAAACAGVILACATPPAGTTETDQFSVPLGVEFFDMGPYLTERLYIRLERAVDNLNGRIARSLEGDPSGRSAAPWYDPLAVARQLRHETPPAVTNIEWIEGDANSEALRRRYPGRIGAYDGANIYHAKSLFHPSFAFTLHISATIQVNGVLCGTDKVGHFFDKGFILYERYRELINRGVDDAKAWEEAVSLGADGSVLYSEGGVLGLWSSGVYSNADLAADYGGLKFYRNLTQPEKLGDVTLPPILVRDGHFWRINDHVRPDSDFFLVYATEHWNEALNPNLYAQGVRREIRRAVERRAERLRIYYADANGNPRPKQYFADKARELSTLKGEPYGHSGKFEDLVGLELCAREPDADVFEAARAGNVEALRVLMRPEDLGAREVKGASLLHIGVASPEVVRFLLDAGADLNARDESGRTPLHWAARIGASESVGALLAAGADVHALDAAGRTPLFDAAACGEPRLIATLVDAGANVDAATSLGVTPLMAAVRLGRADAADALRQAGANIEHTDAFGLTPLHIAAAAGDAECTHLLLTHGASANALTCGGSTPLMLAVRDGHYLAARSLVDAGADALAACPGGRTLLHEAALGGDAACVQLALSLGLPLEGEDADGKTALALAQAAGCDDAVRSLLTAYALAQSGDLAK